jgi:outer membrane protein assembly factor BamB
MPARKEMHMKTRSTILAAVSVCLFALAACANDWPGWRGPQRTGISKETGLLKSWPKDGPKLLWQVTDVGDGYSTPAVVGDRLYVLSNKGTDDEFLQARSVKDGTQIWSVRLGKVGPNQMANYPATRSTPSVDGELVYALGSDGDLVCAKTADGAIVWRKSLRTDFEGVPGLWAYSESPLVDGDLLVCTPGGADATLVALDKKKGALVWKSAIPGGDQAAYASIISVDVGGLKQYVQFLQKGLVGVEAKTGKFQWRYDKTAANSLANIPTPIVHDDYVFSTSGKGGAGLVKVKVDNGKASADEVYFKKGLPSSIGGAVLRGNSLFGTNTNGLLCIDFATGKELWQDPSIGPASVCYADGRLYLHGENGDLALVEPTTEAYREHGRFTPPGQPKRGKSKAWAYPVVANGRLYIRDLGVIWCYDVAEAKAK